MKKNYKKLSYLIVILSAFFIKNSSVFAYNAVPNECVDNGTCILLCNYENTFASETRTISIYYHTRGAWEISSSDGKNKGPGGFSTTFNNKTTGGVDGFLSDGVSASNFVCPANGYIDAEGGVNYCFDNGDGFCSVDKKDSGLTIFGTMRFGSANPTFKSGTKDYDFSNELNAYFNGAMSNAINTISVKDLIDKDGAKNAEKMAEEFNNAIKDNYGGKIPEFIKNSAAYNNTASNVADKVASSISLKSKIETAYINGDITEEERDRALANMTNISEYVGAAVTKKLEENATSGDSWIKMDCNTLLGDPDDKESPAYWLQLGLNVMKYIGIIALLGLSTMDFLKATVSGDKDAIKKATTTTAKRFIFVVILFFLPILIEVIMKLFGAYGTCGIG